MCVCVYLAKYVTSVIREDGGKAERVGVSPTLTTSPRSSTRSKLLSKHKYMDVIVWY